MGPIGLHLAAYVDVMIKFTKISQFSRFLDFRAPHVLVTIATRIISYVYLQGQLEILVA